MLVDEFACSLETAVQIDGSQDGFKDIPENRGPFTASRKIFFPAEIQEIADPDFAAFFRQDRLADEE